MCPSTNKIIENCTFFYLKCEHRTSRCIRKTIQPSSTRYYISQFPRRQGLRQTLQMVNNHRRSCFTWLQRWTILSIKIDLAIALVYFVNIAGTLYPDYFSQFGRQFETSFVSDEYSDLIFLIKFSILDNRIFARTLKCIFTDVGAIACFKSISSKESLISQSHNQYTNVVQQIYMIMQKVVLADTPQKTIVPERII